MNIRKHVLKSVNDGLAATETARDGVSGVLFTGPDEPRDGTFIPFARLGYNSEIGYFDMADFPNEPTDCTNENPETIHPMAVASDAEWQPLVWMQAESGIGTLLGEPSLSAESCQASR